MFFPDLCLFRFFLMPVVNSLKKNCDGYIKRSEKLCNNEKKNLEEHFITNWVNWQQVRNMTGYHYRGAESLSGTGMDRGSPVSEKLCEKSVIENCVVFL